MLLSDKLDILYPCYVQPKLDGVRCVARLINGKTYFFSRNAKLFLSLQHLENKITLFFQDFPNIILDGELYSSQIEFQTLVGLVNRKTYSPEMQVIQFHVFDIIDTNLTFQYRYSLLQSLPLTETIQIVTATFCESQISLEKLHRDYINAGFEGTVLRSFNGMYYVGKHSKTAIKYKNFDTNEFKITNFYTGIDGTIIWQCQTDNKKYFKVRPRGSIQQKNVLLKNAYKNIGKMLTVRFFGYTKNGIPRHPVGLTIRDYE